MVNACAYMWHIVTKSRYKVILVVLAVDVEIFPQSQRPHVLKYWTYDFTPSRSVLYFLCKYINNNNCFNCFVHSVIMWPFSISIWISNPVRIYRNKWYDNTAPFWLCSTYINTSRVSCDCGSWNWLHCHSFLQSAHTRLRMQALKVNTRPLSP